MSEEKKKPRLCLNHVEALKLLTFALLDESILFLIAKLVFPAEVAMPSTGLLGLGSKLYPGNKQLMLDLTRYRVVWELLVWSVLICRKQ